MLLSTLLILLTGVEALGLTVLFKRDPSSVRSPRVSFPRWIEVAFLVPFPIVAGCILQLAMVNSRRSPWLLPLFALIFLACLFALGLALAVLSRGGRVPALRTTRNIMLALPSASLAIAFLVTMRYFMGGGDALGSGLTSGWSGHAGRLR